MLNFLGLNMKPGREYTQTIETPFLISGIAIGDGETAELYVTLGKKTFLAAKVSNVIPQVPLNLYFSRDDKIMFKIKGDAWVSLVGYWYNNDSDKSDERSANKNKNGKEAGAQAEDDDDEEGKEEDDDDQLPIEDYETIPNAEISFSDLDFVSDPDSISDSDGEVEVAQPKAKIGFSVSDSVSDSDSASDSESGSDSLSDSDDEEEVEQPKAKVAKLSPETIAQKGAKEQNGVVKKDKEAKQPQPQKTKPEAKKEQPTRVGYSTVCSLARV